MSKRLLRFLDAHLWGLFTLLAVLFYLALLAGRSSLSGAYEPVVAVLALALIGMGIRRLCARTDWVTRLRVDAPALLLGGLLLLALALRLLRSPQAVPAPGTDEAYFIGEALGIIRTGEYIPSSLRYPSLLVYAELATSVLRFLTGASSNLWTWPSELAPEHLYGWGRGLVTLLGTATLLPVYWIGARLYSRRAGLLAAFFLALVPMHVATGGIIGPEVPAALLATLASWFSLRLLEEGKVRWALAAGICAGLATGTHYPAVLVPLVPLLALCLRPAEDVAPGKPVPRWGLVLLTVLGASFGFLVACPAVLFQTDRLVTGLAEAARAYFPAEGGAGSGLRYLLLEGVGIGPALLTLLGAVLVLPRFRRQEAVLWLFPVAAYLALLIPRARFPHDLVLLAPWVALLAAAGLDRISAILEKKWPDHPLVYRWLPWGLALVGGGLLLQALW